MRSGKERIGCHEVILDCNTKDRNQLSTAANPDDAFQLKWLGHTKYRKSAARIGSRFCNS